MHIQRSNSLHPLMQQLEDIHAFDNESLQRSEADDSDDMKEIFRRTMMCYDSGFKRCLFRPCVS